MTALLNLLRQRKGLLIVGLGWMVVTSVFAVATSAGASTIAVLVALGLVVLVALQIHRKQEWTVRETRKQHDMAKLRLSGAEGKLAGVEKRVSEFNLDVATKLEAVERDLVKQSAEVKSESAETRKLVRETVKREARNAYFQLEALLNLHAMLPVTGRVPRTRIWAASPDMLLTLVDLIRTGRPGLIVECGSGASTLWMALAIRQFGLDGRVVALEHSEPYANQTRAYLDNHGVSALAEVRIAQLEEMEVDGQPWQWYAMDAWGDLKDIDLLFVDGPPGTVGEQARFPGVPLLWSRLSDAAVVVVDDTDRQDERRIVEHWLESMPELTAERLLLEKGAMVLRRTARDDG